MKFHRILILAEDNRASQSVVQTGYQWASGMGAKVFLTHIIDEALAMGNVDAGIFPDEALRRMRLHVGKLLNDFRDDYGKGTETTILMPVGDIKKVIPEVIGETGADLIVMGAHSRSLFERMIEGDPDESVLRVSTVPVLVVPVNKRKE